MEDTGVHELQNSQGRERLAQRRDAEAAVLGDRDVVGVVPVAAEMDDLGSSREGDRGTRNGRCRQPVADQPVDGRQVDRRMAIGGGRCGRPEDSEGDEHENHGQPADPPRAPGHRRFGDWPSERLLEVAGRR